MKQHSPEWYAHMLPLFMALYISESYAALSKMSSGYWSKRKPYLNAKSVVMYDRVLNGETE